MRIHRLAALSSISGARKPQQFNHQKQQQPPQAQAQLPAEKHTAVPRPQIRLPYPRTRQDFLAYRLSGISRNKLCQESSDPEIDLRRFVGNSAVNRASVDWVHRDLMRRVDEIEERQREVMAGIEVMHLEAV
ncbi:conserved hypothetical protein [Paecilomyces variotii No. 5]|uniref:Uncharacterized protein n=1 Tax=Byssochlamys spectabilis (strain No. 5 / NBRC 109023) TaxID=1356009 RepID=V5G6I9_BYSSN|nr:conserved hypothetical protein [Paecilomyces variotii No. 5]